jgi:NAD(P)-dependent dehydrogenase (short-subunit alcohol dehydrogenase family)
MTTELFNLIGHVAVVTGSSRGIGLAIARQFLECGANLVVSGHDPDETSRAREALNADFPADVAGSSRVTALAGDVSDPDFARNLVKAAHDAFGHLDAIVCNAGIDIIKQATDYNPAEWDQVIAVNLKGAFMVAQSAAVYWKERAHRGGSITITSSIAGSVGIPTLAPYAASKGGLNQLVRTLAVEWAQDGIRANAVAPGYVDNVMAGVTVHADPASEERIRRFTPMGRRGRLEEIAAPFAFLASPAATYITGAILAVDGGYTAL